MKSAVNKGLLVIVALLSFGCAGGPSESMTERDAMASAQKHAISKLIEVKDLKKENGWQDKNSGNYTIRYEYNLVSKYSYGDILLDVAKDFENEAQQMNPLEAAGMFLGLTFNFALSGEKEQFQAVLRDHKGVNEFANKEYPEGGIVKNGEMILMVARAALETIGFKPEYKPGSNIGRQVTYEYMKTDNGWRIAR